MSTEAEQFLGPDTASGVVDAPRPSDVEQWKPLYSGLDKPVPEPQQSALDFLDAKIGADPENRAQAINQAYVQSKLRGWTLSDVQGQWPSIRQAFAKEKQLTQGEPIADAALYNKIAKQLDEEEKKRSAQRLFEQQFSHLTPVSHLFSENALNWWNDSNKPLVDLPDAPAMPNLPAYGFNNPAVGAGVWNGYLKPLVEGFATPLSLGTLGIGGMLSEAKTALPLAKHALTTITGLFGGLMAKNAIERAPETAKILKDPNSSTQDIIAAVGKQTVDSALALTAGLHVVMELHPNATALASAIDGKTPQEAAQVMREEANKTPQPALRDALVETADKLDEVPAPVAQSEPFKEPETPSSEETTVKPKETEFTVTPEKVSKAYSIKNSAVEAELDKMNSPEADRGAKLTRTEAINNAAEELAKDPEAGMKLVDDLMVKSRPPSGNEVALLNHELVRLSLERDNAQTVYDKAVKTGEEGKISQAADVKDKIQQDYENTADVLKEAGKESSYSLSFRQMAIKEDYSLAATERRIKEQRFEPEEAVQVRQLQQKVGDTQKAFDDYRSQMSELLMEDEGPQRQSGKGKPPNAFMAKFSERAVAARERIKKRVTSGQLSSGIDPALLADYAIVGADYIAKGAKKFGDWSQAMIKEFGENILPHLKSIYEKAKTEHGEERRLKSFKTRKTETTEEFKRRVAEQDFSPKAKATLLRLDPEAMRLEAENVKAKEEYQAAFQKKRLAERSLTQKTGDTFLKWRRGFLLSSPVTLAKLTAAAAQRMASTPLEEAIGGLLGKIPGISRVAEQAPREGGISASAESKSITSAFNEGMNDAVSVLKNGRGDLDTIFGKKSGNVTLSDVTPRSVIEFFGNLHGALKAPVKRAEFTRAFEKRVEFAINHGTDVSDPLVQTSIAVQAYKDANRAIFMQDNMVTDAYKRALSRFEQEDKTTGKPSPGGQAVSVVLKAIFPIVKVPTNIVAEISQYATGLGTGGVRLINALASGVDKLSPEQADLIMRELKKGSIGTAALLMGYLNPDTFGGYYQPGEKREEHDAKAGSIRIGETDIPSYLLHNPLMETFQIGATVRRVADSKLHKHDPQNQGIANGTWAAALGLIEEVPFARETVEMGKIFDPQERQYAEGELLKSILIPAVIQWIATKTDTDEQGNPVKRKPKTRLQHIESGIPGLRQNAPVKGSVQPVSRE